MKIYPALDLLDGQCVRLRQGIFEDKTVYSETPKSVVREMEEAGAEYLHLVDLSGAKNPKMRQVETIRELVEGSSLKIQTGGGIRDLSDAQRLLETGVERVVLGSMAVQKPSLAALILKELSPSRITLALDLKISEEGRLQAATEGWKETDSGDVFEWISFFQDAGVTRILCTDIARDGMLQGPNFLLYQTLMERFPKTEFQASGGISSLDDLRTLSRMGIHSAIVGKALYERRFTLQEALLPC